MASHLQFAIEENIRNGMSPQKAERQARISFGGPQQSKEIIANRAPSLSRYASSRHS